MATTQFDKIYYGLSPEVGKFRVAASGMAWKGEENDTVTAIPSAEIKWVQWYRVARNFQLRVGLKDRRRETFDGFLREDHDKLAGLLKQHFAVTLEVKDVTFKGWNWGVTDIQGQDLAFLVSNKTAFELPLNQVANSNIAGRTEVSLEFAPSTPSGKKPSRSAPDEMVEIRFYVPGTQARARGSDAGSQKSDDEEEGEEMSAAQAFHDAIKDKADIGQVSGDLVLSFEEVLVLTPRGRYDVDMFLDFLRLRGKTYDYKILYSSIARLFLLPKDDQHVLFILGLSTPIRQGQTRYSYLVMQFAREEETTAELNMSEEDIEKYDRLKKNYEDPTFEVVSGVFRALSKKKIISLGSFKSRDGHPGIKANLKAVQGDLFMLEKYIFFVSKQPTLIEISDIHQCVFSRVGASMGATAARTFDLKIVTKGGPEYTFTSINKEEHEPVEAYLKDKKVKLKNEMVPDVDMLAAGGDSSDEEMQSVASSGDEAPKPRLGGDDEDSEEDEDFQASSTDEGSPSESDSDSDGGVTASDASGDRELANAAKGKKKLTKKKAKGKTDGSEAGDDEDKPKKKAKGKSGGGEAGASEDKPKKKAKGKAAGSEAGDDEEKPKKTAPKPKPKPKAKKQDDDAMDVDEDEEPKAKPKPKPKPKPKASGLKEGEEDEPVKKKPKVSSD
ncbi:structure-specific recognition protein-domain-containing protein [Suillus paluster]|uniref:structure-specific recognition protein-domain-containing protein n=1 Tax=Suillus paluster TaxID=48578 RepID=UPI001B8853A8|nr:structure-specific recognition protein-domain-containing protein [Suillus paluster]KAG1745880.1 structure-specific recognition protein-domain-containing protein [Suillus paluster]